MEKTQKPRVIIIAGPNGAGKTTFAREFLPEEADCPVFINADLIAAGLSPFDPSSASIAAGRLMLKELSKYSSESKSFAFETTLAGLTYARMIPKWQKSGFEVFIIFLSLQSVDDAIKRVAQRVLQGGHDIPENTIRRRFAKGFNNFKSIYAPIVDGWALYDSSGETPILLDWAERK